ncbi:MAG: hypothetical protein ACM3NT_08310 [Methylocystaceae bacterium]
MTVCFVLAKSRKEFESRADKDLIQNMNIRVQVKVKLKNYGESG